MTHLGEPDYVCLLSAAAYHGAAHQAPMLFQVMLSKSRRRLGCGDLDNVEAEDLATPLDPTVQARGAYMLPLAPWTEMTGAARDARWRLNVDVEPDL